MNFFKRAFASITRRKGKSLILFAIVFVLGNVIAGAISIRQATESVEKNIKSQLGARATISQDFDLTSAEDFDYNSIKIYTVKEIKEIGESPYVKYYDYSAGFYPGEQKKVKGVELEDEDINGGSSMGQTVQLKGVNNGEFLDVMDKKIEIIEGRTFNQDEVDKGEAVLIVSDKVAEANNWHVDDKVIYDIYQPDYDDQGNKKDVPILEKDIPCTVIGIFKQVANDEKDSSKKLNEQQKWESYYKKLTMINQAYAPNKLIQELNIEQTKAYNAVWAAQGQEVTEVDEDAEYYQPTYVLKSPEDTEAFKQDAEAILGKPWKILASTDQYDSIAGSVKGMSKISTYVLYIAIGASLLIVTLVVLLFLRDRKHELGIYLSLGEKRGKVIGQIVIEVFVISFVAITLSVFTGNILAKGVSGSLMNSEMLSGSTSDPYGESYYYGELSDTTLSDSDVKDAYEVKLSASYIIIFYVIGLSTILLSTIVPLIYILRLNPKKIMM